MGFPSGQRGRAVNPLAQPSQVRILPPPSQRAGRRGHLGAPSVHPSWTTAAGGPPSGAAAGTGRLRFLPSSSREPGSLLRAGRLRIGKRCLGKCLPFVPRAGALRGKLVERPQYVGIDVHPSRRFVPPSEPLSQHRVRVVAESHEPLSSQLILPYAVPQDAKARSLLMGFGGGSTSSRASICAMS